MKFRKVDKFDEFEEEFSTEYSKKRHYDQHVVKEKQFDNISLDEYETIADDLAKRPVDYKTILGYETEAPKDDNRRRFAKYNKETGDFVVYGLDENNEPVIVSLHRKTLREYTIDHAIKYVGEIPEGF